MDDSSQNKVIEIREVNAFYGDRQILSDISLDVYHREILVIMGHSGSGKTTLLRNILGLNHTASGTIKVLGKNLSELDRKGLFELRQQFGVAFQSGALFSSMNVLENVELPLHEHTRLDQNTIRIMARLKLELMGLADNDALMPAELSGGMLKRAGLARAVVMDPELLFFDEPSAGLDPVTSAELDELILQLRDAMNMTIVVVTHELESAFKIADRITILDQGKQIMTGSKDEVMKSTDPRIINMLQRRSINETVDADEYLDQLTRE